MDYKFKNSLKTAKIVIPYAELKEGTPISISGAVTNGSGAFGIVKKLGDKFVGNGGFFCEAEVIVAGYLDENECEKACGLTYTDNLKSALANIVFVDSFFKEPEPGRFDFVVTSTTIAGKKYYSSQSTITHIKNAVALGKEVWLLYKESGVVVSEAPLKGVDSSSLATFEGVPNFSFADGVISISADKWTVNATNTIANLCWSANVTADVEEG